MGRKNSLPSIFSTINEKSKKRPAPPEANEKEFQLNGGKGKNMGIQGEEGFLVCGVELPTIRNEGELM